jgi:hypothetical protein
MLSLWCKILIKYSQVFVRSFTIIVSVGIGVTLVLLELFSSLFYAMPKILAHTEQLLSLSCRDFEGIFRAPLGFFFLCTIACLRVGLFRMYIRRL